MGLVIALVVLRLATGWHFYREGTKKLAYNADTGVTTIAFSAEPFLRQAVGPVADMVKEELPAAYNWERYLAVPRQARPTTEEELEKRAKWEADYARAKHGPVSMYVIENTCLRRIVAKACHLSLAANRTSLRRLHCRQSSLRMIS